MKRTFDFFLALILLLASLWIISLVALAVKLTSKGSVLYYSERVGKDNKTFFMPKFRTMKISTPQLATHLLADSDRWLTPIGSFLRKTSLDETPQLWSILIGDMSFVGPRPALFNQDDLISLRTLYGIDKLLPGLTGLAQINGRDELSTPIKVQYDLEYLHKQSFWFDMKIIAFTFLKVVRHEGVSH